MKVSTVILTCFLAVILMVNVTMAINWRGNWAFACDFTENNLQNVQMRGEECGGKCEDTEGCTHFAWTKYNGGTCWMKQGAVTKDDAVANNDYTMVCGVSSRAGQGQPAETPPPPDGSDA